MLCSQPRLSPVLSALLIASLHPLPSFTVRFGLLPSAPSHGGLVLLMAIFGVTAFAFYLACAITAGALLPYRRWGTVFVPTAAVPLLGNGICAYRCHTIVVRWYMCLFLPYHRCEMVYVLLHCCTDPGGPVFVLTCCVGVPRCVCCALAARVCILTLLTFVVLCV